MRIEIVDIPNNQVIKNIKLEMTFENGKIEAISQDIKHVNTKTEQTLPTDIANRDVKEIPQEMQDIQF